MHRDARLISPISGCKLSDEDVDSLMLLKPAVMDLSAKSKDDFAQLLMAAFGKPGRRARSSTIPRNFPCAAKATGLPPCSSPMPTRNTAAAPADA